MTCKSETQSVQSMRQPSDPDIHPELTLEQIKKPVIHQKRKRHSKGGTVMNQELDINTMFDFHSRMGLKSYSSTISTVNKTRRKSIAVIGAEKQRKKDYFETHHLNLQTSRQLTCQSNSAVHYLAISPPRIRITDDKGSVSPDMFGGRLNAKPTQTKTRKDSEGNEELDQIGELISKISKVETVDIKRRTSSTSSSNSSSSTTSVSVFTRGSSIDSRRSSETSRGGYWSHRSRFVLY